jgi:hypothetical protein
MKSYNAAIMRALKRTLVALSLLFGLAGGQSLAADRFLHHKGVSLGSYHGWQDSLILSNAQVEAIVVPAVGHVIQFHFLGEGDVFWESEKLQGKSATPGATEWANFGGDKSWPSPQADWPKMIGRGWPPPATFDATLLQARAQGHEVNLASPVDPAYGIRVRRHIQLDPHRPILSITTTYEKVSGAPVKVGIGVITQLRDPQRAFIQLPPKSQFPEGYVLLNFEKPQNRKLQDGLFSLTRDHDHSSQIGNDGSSLLWMNEKYALRIDSPHVDGAEYANQGSSAVVYTNPDPDAYVELETYGPLITMKAGDKIQRTNVYTLSKRTEKDPETEAERSCPNDIFLGIGQSDNLRDWRAL